MLQRTDSFLSLSDYQDELSGRSFLHMTPSPPPSPPPSPRFPPLTRAQLRFREQHLKSGRKRAEFTIGSTLPKRSRTPPKPQSPAVPVRTTSPLAPTRKLLPPRATFPRSKPEPDLYRTALKGRMRSSPEGEQILSMGPRLAIAILSATKELERIVSAHEDDDVTMGDDTEPTRSSWGLGRDRVAVPCGA